MGKSSAGHGRPDVVSRFSKIALAVIVAVLATGCAHSTVTGLSEPHTAGAVPHDAWGNPIIVSENRR